MGRIQSQRTVEAGMMGLHIMHNVKSNEDLITEMLIIHNHFKLPHYTLAGVDRTTHGSSLLSGKRKDTSKPRRQSIKISLDCNFGGKTYKKSEI
jgi:hypothetical protein